MTSKFVGTFDEMQARILDTGIIGEWRDFGNHKQFRTDDGAILNWWHSTGKIALQGTAGQTADELQSIFAVARSARNASPITDELKCLREEIVKLNTQVREMVEIVKG